MLPKRGRRSTSRRGENLFGELAERIASDGPPHQHPWRGVGRDALDPSEMQGLRDALDALAANLMNLVVCAERACTLFGLSLPETFGEMARLLKIAEAAAAMPECDRRAFCSAAWGRAEDVAEIVEKGERFSKLRSAFDSAFVEFAWAASLDECRATLADQGPVVVPAAQLTLSRATFASEVVSQGSAAEERSNSVFCWSTG